MFRSNPTWSKLHNFYDYFHNVLFAFAAKKALKFEETIDTNNNVYIIRQISYPFSTFSVRHVKNF